MARGQIPVNQVGPNDNGFHWIEIPGLRVYSCYWTPNCSIAEFEDFVLRLEQSVRSSALPCVVAGDFKAKSRHWGSLREDRRGTILADMMSALDLYVCNSGALRRSYEGSRSRISISP